MSVHYVQRAVCAASLQSLQDWQASQLGYTAPIRQAGQSIAPESSLAGPVPAVGCTSEYVSAMYMLAGSRFAFCQG